MTLLLLATFLTVGISAVCSLLEAMVLSTTDTDLDLIRQRHKKAGAILEKRRQEMDGTISSILTLNTIANTLGAVVIGGIAANIFDGYTLAAIPFIITILILFFSEIIPKNIGVAYRQTLLPLGARPLELICYLFQPVTLLSGRLVAFFLKNRPNPTGLQVEILALIDRGGKNGSLSRKEQSLLRNALSMDNVTISQVMTPRTVVTSLDQDDTVEQTVKAFGTIPFARMPIYGENLDDITGIVRRRDILQAVAAGELGQSLRELAKPPLFLAETSYLQNALDQLLEAHQPLAIAVDEYGGFAGVISMEDLLEFLIGREFYERDDPATDMRSLAREKAAEKVSNSENPPPADPPAGKE